jgi:hypothetical protein
MTGQKIQVGKLSNFNKLEYEQLLIMRRFRIGRLGGLCGDRGQIKKECVQCASVTMTIAKYRKCEYRI